MVRKGKEKAATPKAASNTLTSWLTPKSTASTSASIKRERERSKTPATVMKRRKVKESPVSDAPIASTSKVRLSATPAPSAPSTSVVYDVDNEEEIAVDLDPEVDVALGDDFGPPELKVWEDDPDEAEVMVLDEEEGAMMCCPICGKDLGMAEEKVRRPPSDANFAQAEHPHRTLSFTLTAASIYQANERGMESSQSQAKRLSWNDHLRSMRERSSRFRTWKIRRRRYLLESSKRCPNTSRFARPTHSPPS